MRNEVEHCLERMFRFLSPDFTEENDTCVMIAAIMTRIFNLLEMFEFFIRMCEGAKL